MHKLITTLSISSLLLSPLPVLAETAIINAAADTYVDAANPDTAYGAANLLALTFGSALQRSRTMVRFDLGTIPAGSTIESAILDFLMTSASGGTIQIGLYPISQNWLEGSVTWNAPPTTGELFANVLLSNLPGAAHWDISNLVRNWHGGTTSNYGVLLLPQEQGTAYTRILSSREGSRAPQLQITYTPPTDTAPPVLTDIASVPRETDATIVVNSNEQANVIVDYGSSPSYGSSTTGTTEPIQGDQHRFIQQIPGLTPGTRYHYRFRVTDTAGNTTTSEDNMFTTLATSGTGDKALLDAGCAPGVNVGTRFKTPTLAAVYYCSELRTRHAFPNDKVYLSWYADFDGIVTVDESVVRGIALGIPVRPRPGARLVQFVTLASDGKSYVVTDPRVYATDTNGRLRWITSAEVAAALFGSRWETLIIPHLETDFTRFSPGTDITAAGDYALNADVTSQWRIDVDLFQG